MLLLHGGLNSTFGFAILDGQTQVFETESEQKPGICKVFTFRKTPSRGGFACRERSMAFLVLALSRFDLFFPMALFLCFHFYRTQVYLGSDLWVLVSVTE